MVHIGCQIQRHNRYERTFLITRNWLYIYCLLTGVKYFFKVLSWEQRGLVLASCTGIPIHCLLCVRPTHTFAHYVLIISWLCVDVLLPCSPASAHLAWILPHHFLHAFSYHTPFRFKQSILFYIVILFKPLVTVILVLRSKYLSRYGSR